MKYSIINIRNDFNSYQRLISFYNTCSTKSEIRLCITGWFSANMSAALGALLHQLRKQNTSCQLGDIDNKAKNILLKNGFLGQHFGTGEQKDKFHTTIPYKKLDPNENSYFKDYVNHELLDSEEIPNISQDIREAITKLLYTLFTNAQKHSHTEHIYTCGQFFPRKHKLEFTLVDTGTGFKDPINQKLNSKLSASEAIKSAMQDNATSPENTDGLSLVSLKKFITHNNGKMQIVSTNGFYQLHDGIEESAQFEGAFPGTIVNLQLNTKDLGDFILKMKVGD